MLEQLEAIKTMDKQELHKFIQDLYVTSNGIRSEDFVTLLRACEKREYELLELL